MIKRPGTVATAIMLSVLAVLLFDLMALIIKYLRDDYRAAELSAYRNFFGLVPSAIVLWSSREWHRRGRTVRIRQWPLAFFRGFCTTCAQFMYYVSLSHLDFASAATIGYSSALFVTAYSVPILGERVGLVRWSAVVLGFTGVVMVVGPGRDTFTWYALLPLGAASLYALSAVCARKMDTDVPSPLVNLYSSSFAVFGATVFALATGGFSPIGESADLFWIVAMGTCGGCAVLCLVVAYRMTEPSNLAPFSYFGIPSAFALGWLFFGEAPFQELFPGVLLIVAAGLIIVWRERRLQGK